MELYTGTQKCTRMHASILCPYWYKILVCQLMRTSISAFHLFPWGDPSTSKGWWHFLCIDMFDMPLASLRMVLHCLHTAT